MSAPAAHPLTGWRVLVPTGGDLGARLANTLTGLGALVDVAPVITFTPPTNPGELGAALAGLAAGDFDWLAVTSATTVRVLADAAATIPPTTRVAAVGTATAAALRAAGYRVDFVPAGEHSAAAMVEQWPADGGSVLIPQSAIAGPVLADGLRGRGLAVHTVDAYRTEGVALPRPLVDAVAGGEFAAIVLTSGSIARQLYDQLAPLPAGTILACIGEPTALAARAAGLTVTAIAQRASASSLGDALVNLRA